MQTPSQRLPGSCGTCRNTPTFEKAGYANARPAFFRVFSGMSFTTAAVNRGTKPESEARLPRSADYLRRLISSINDRAIKRLCFWPCAISFFTTFTAPASALNAVEWRQVIALGHQGCKPFNLTAERFTFCQSCAGQTLLHRPRTSSCCWPPKFSAASSS